MQRRRVSRRGIRCCLIARGSTPRNFWRHQPRHARHEQGVRGQCRGLELCRAARHYPDRVERGTAGHRPVLLGRPRCQCLDRRDGRHARVWHHSCQIWHNSGQYPRVRGCYGRRHGDPNRHKGDEAIHRLRPNPLADRIRGHAGDHHRTDPKTARPARGRHGRHLPFPRCRGRRKLRDPDNPVGPAHGSD